MDENYREFWQHKENDLNQEFLNGKHKPEKYFEIRSKIRQHLEENKRPAPGTCLLTDWYSYKSKPDSQKDLVLRCNKVVCMPSDSCLEKYYKDVIVKMK